MEPMKKKKSYAHLLAALALCGWTALSFSAQPPIPAKDDYKVFIQKGSPSTSKFYYAFHRTNVTGSTIDPEFSGTILVAELDSQSRDVWPSKFPALERSEKLSQRATQYTRLFVSLDEAALLARVRNTATADQKKLVVSQRVPQIIRGYCTGALNFIVNEKNGKLSIKVDDQRKCMRSGSDQAKLARTAELGKKRQQAQQEREAQLHIKDLAKIINVEAAAARKAQQEVRQKQQELREAEQNVRVFQEAHESLSGQVASAGKQQKELVAARERVVLLEQELGLARIAERQAKEREKKSKEELAAEKEIPVSEKFEGAVRRVAVDVRGKLGSVFSPKKPGAKTTKSPQSLPPVAEEFEHTPGPEEFVVWGSTE